MKTVSLILTFILASSLRADIQAPYLMPALLSGTRLIIPQALWQGETEEALVALSFDDGPSRFTPALLDVLKQENVSATFFILGDRAQKYPHTLRRLQKEGHLIALHGSVHVNLHGKPDSWLLTNISAEKELLSKTLGKNRLPTRWFFRPPFGALSKRIIRTIQSTDTRVVMCTILPGQQGLWPDIWTENPDVTTARILRDLSPGGIIGLHDGEDLGLKDAVFNMPQAAETARLVIRALKKKGYRFVRMDQLPDPSWKKSLR
jgi:peptidoglycan-N-acetylglucosamine deacetylase